MIKIEKEALSGLGRVIKLINPKGPGFERAVWLRPMESNLAFCASGRDVDLVVRVPARCGPGKPLGVEDGLKFCQVLQKLGDGEITLEPEAERLLVRQQRRRFSFALVDPSWEPEAMPGITGDGVHVDGPAAGVCLKFIQSSVAADVTVDGVLGCAFIEKAESGINVVGFNAFQLALMRHARTGLENLDQSILIPGRYLPLVCSVLDEGVFTCQVRDQRLVMRSADLSITMDLPLYTQEQFFDYQPVIQPLDGTDIVLDPAEVVDALARLETVSAMDGMAFCLEAGEDGQALLRIKSSAGEGEEAVWMDAGGDFEPVRFGVGPFAAVLKNIPAGAGRVVLSVAGPDQPCRLRPVDTGDDVLVIVMPVMQEGGDIEQNEEAEAV